MSGMHRNTLEETIENAVAEVI